MVFSWPNSQRSKQETFPRWGAKRKRGRKRRAHTKNNRVARLERLEDRVVMSANFFQQDHVFGDRVDDTGVETFAQAGNAIAVDGDLMVVGARAEDVNGLPQSGAAFVYQRSDNGTPLDETDDFWSQQARLTASDADYNDQFGTSVAISGDSIVVGSSGDDLDTDGDGSIDAYSAGSAYVYSFDSSWSEQQKLTASDAAWYDHFGTSVAISGDSIVVGSRFDDLDTDGDGSIERDAGSAYVYSFDSTASWSQQQKLTASDGDRGDQFGTSVAISGDSIVVGSLFDDLDTDGDGSIDAYNAGSAYVYSFDSTSSSWSEQQKLTASDADGGDHFGTSVAISGDSIVVGSSGDDLDTDGDGSIDRPNTGSAQVFRFDGQAWSEEDKVFAWRQESGPEAFANFGRTVAVDGDLMIVGSPFENTNAYVDAGAAYVYQRSDNGTPLDEADDFWSQQARLTASDGDWGDQFGTSVAISGDSIVVGSRFDDLDTDGDGSIDAYWGGSAYVYSFDSTTSSWSEQQKLTASDADYYDRFGTSVAISGDSIVVGSPRDDVDADGDGTQELIDAGSAYVFAEVDLRADISGFVFADVDGDGQFDVEDAALADVPITLVEAVDDVFGNGDDRVWNTTTDKDGFYLFEKVDEGLVRVIEDGPADLVDGLDTLPTSSSLNPAGYSDMDTVNDQFTIDFLLENDLESANFAEQADTSGVNSGDTASIGFWQNRNGQALTTELEARGLQNWLLSKFDNVFEASDFSNGVFHFYKNEFFKAKLKGTPKVDAQFMATALATFATSSNLASDAVAADFGFNVTESGIGSTVINVGNGGEAFDVADNSDMTILALLEATNSLTGGGSGTSYLYDNGDGDFDDEVYLSNLQMSVDELTLRSLANELYTAINEGG